MHQNKSFSHQKIENFLGREHRLQTPSLWGEDTAPFPYPTPQVPPLQLDPGYGTDTAHSLTMKSGQPLETQTRR